MHLKKGCSINSLWLVMFDLCMMDNGVTLSCLCRDALQVASGPALVRLSGRETSLMLSYFENQSTKVVKS